MTRLALDKIRSFIGGVGHPSQRERFDADGSYCRRWLPEWGTDAYPVQMINLGAEAAEAKERFGEASR